MRHIISVLLENESGALSRVAGLFSARGYNIESLTLVDVAGLQDITVSGHLEREIVLIKLAIEADKKDNLDRIIDAFQASLSDVAENQFIVEMSGSSEKIDELIKSLSNANIIEVVRSGVIGLASGKRALTVS